MSNLYINTPRLVLGFHGCDEQVAHDILLLKSKLKPSTNDYDWLGHGMYFWENDPQRALEWARKSGKKKPAVIGAVIDLGNCLSLMERDAIELLKAAHKSLLEHSKQSRYALPKNTRKIEGHEIKRRLDCAVFMRAHEIIEEANQPAYDTVIGAFMEGLPAYDGTEITEQTHIQICVRNTDCIKGYFLPLNH